MATVKVPKEIQDLFFEAIACESLRIQYGQSWLPSAKAIYYGARAEKARMYAWRALIAAHPSVSFAEWSYDPLTGIATKREEPKAKVPRKPRAAKAVVPTQGEVK